MKICTIDGIAHHAKYLLRAELPKPDRSRLVLFPATDDGIICFTEKEKDRAEAYLKGQGIDYEIEELPAPANWSRTAGVKYASLEEVKAHIQEGIEPESTIIPRLQERLKAAEEKAARVDALEARLQSLEKASKIAEEIEK